MLVKYGGTRRHDFLPCNDGEVFTVRRFTQVAVVSPLILGYRWWNCHTFSHGSLPAFQKTFLDLNNFIHAPLVPPAPKGRAEPGLDDLLGEVDADQPGAQGEHVGVVVLAAVDGGRVVITQRSAHARHFVRRYRAADARAIHEDAAPSLARADQAGDSVGEVGVIHRLGRVCAAVNHRVAQCGYKFLQRFFEREAAVIRAEGHDLTPQPRPLPPLYNLWLWRGGGGGSVGDGEGGEGVAQAPPHDAADDLANFSLTNLQPSH